jgi:hypothetical protein
MILATSWSVDKELAQTFILRICPKKVFAYSILSKKAFLAVHEL